MTERAQAIVKAVRAMLADLEPRELEWIRRQLADRPAVLDEKTVLAALDAHGWNIGETATALGIARRTLQAHLRRLGIGPLRAGRPSRVS